MSKGDSYATPRVMKKLTRAKSNYLF